MEKLKKQFDQTQKALNTLYQVLEHDLEDPIIRDSLIKRFEYTWDSFWKYLKEYIEQAHSIKPEIPTPKSIFRAALKLTIISEEEFYNLLKTVDDRNRTAHIYNEDLAQDIALRIPEYALIFKNILTKTAPENI